MCSARENEVASSAVSWTEALSAVSGSVTALLSLVAVAVSMVLARAASKQSKDIADAQAHRELEARMAERSDYVLARGKTALRASHTIYALLSPRLSELLAEGQPGEAQRRTLRHEVRQLLADLAIEVALLRAIDYTSGGPDRIPAEGFAALLNEAAWLETDANHLAFLVFDPSEEGREVDLEDKQAVVDELLNGSFVNLNSRLLAECAGFEPRSVPSWNEPGSPWPKIYKKREKVLLASSILPGSWSPSSLAEAAARSLNLSCDRFEDALVNLLQDLGRE